jgi:sugar lactone lactonase YvrE
MSRDISMIKRVSIILVFLVFSVFMKAEPYKPYPILWVHGYADHSSTWGAETFEYEEGKFTDSIVSVNSYPIPTYAHFLDYMHPYAIEWYKYEKDYLGIPPTYTIPGEDAYPNKTFLEVINFKETVGSVNEDAGGWPPPFGYQEGWGEELRKRIRGVLEEYYGEGWESNSDAKVILICHSMGGLAARWAVTLEPSLGNHIDRIITTGTPNIGSPFMDPIKGDALFFSIIFWIPGMEFWNKPAFGSNGFWPKLANYLVIGSNFMFAAFNVVTSFTTHKYTDAGHDLRTELLSSFIRDLKTAENLEKQSSTQYVAIVSTLGTGSEFGSFLAKGALALTGVSIALHSFPPNLFMIALKASSLFPFFNWIDNSDLAVYEESQAYYVGKLPTRDLIRRHGVIHMTPWTIIEDKTIGETQDAGAFLDALVEPPVIHWNKIVGTQQLPDSTYSDTIFDISDSVEINLGRQIPDSLIGSIDDYFLADCDIFVSFNFGEWQKLNWMEDYGFNGNNFVLRGLNDEKVVFPGVNQIEMRARNLMGERGRKRKFRLKWNPFFTHIEFLLPESDACFRSPLDTTFQVYFEDNLGEIKEENLRITIDNNVYKDTVVSSVNAQKDTLECSVFIEEGEGIYLIEAVCINNDGETTKNIERFFIDNTPPEPLITLPVEEDSVVHSSRVENFMPLVFTLSDNFDTLINTPKNEEAFIEIRDSADNLVWRDTIGTDTIQAGCYYNLPKRIYWDFRDLNGKKVLNSGKYNIIISCLDKAENFGSDTSFFFLDNDPPEIEVVSPFDSLLTSNESFVELEYTINEDTEIKLSWIDKDGREALIRDGYASPDTNRFFEGGDMYGNYLADGLYTPRFNAKDNAGNDTTYIEGIVEGGTLQVDRTPPSIYDLATPWIVGPDNKVNVTFKVSEDMDNSDNRGEVIVKIYIDGTQVDSSSVNPGKSKIEIKREFDISEYRNGTHQITVTAEDKWGNINTRMTEIVKGTIGTKISQPENGDTLGQGWVIVKGLANDPDMYNTIPFGGFGLYRRQASSFNWDSTGIIVPEVLRTPGMPLHRGIKPVTNISDIARWNTEGLSGLYKLLLTSKEEDGGLVLADTVSVFIESEPMISPLISDFLVNIEGGNGDTIFEPADGEIVTASYVLRDKPADVSLDVLNQSGRNMAHLEQKGRIAVSSSPPSMEREGIYLYFYDNKWWVRWRFENIGIASGEILSLENKSFLITDTLDTLTSVRSVQEGKIEFNCVNISDSIYEGGFNFTGEGRIQFELSFNEKKDVWIAGSKLSCPFILGTPSSFSYDGFVFGEGHLPGGRYTLRVSANSIDGMGYDEESDKITTKTDLAIIDSLVSDRAYPLDTLPATLKYLVNQKARVKIDVYKGSTFLLNIEEIDSVAGGRWQFASWNGVINNAPAEYGDNYRFKITAFTLPDFTDSDSVFSDNFTVLDSLSSEPGNFFIPPDYYVGKIHNDSVFNGKTDFLWEASAEGELYRPMIYRFADTAKGIREIEIDWEVKVERKVEWFERIDTVEASVTTYESDRWYMSMQGDTFTIPYDQRLDYELYCEVNLSDFCMEYGGCGYDVEAWIDTLPVSDIPETGECGTVHRGSMSLREGQECVIFSYAYAYDIAGSGLTSVESYAHARYNIGGRTLEDSVNYIGKDIILSNQTTKLEIGQFVSEPFDPEIWSDSTTYTYTLTTTIDGITKSASKVGTGGQISLNTNGVTVSIGNIPEGKIYAHVDTTNISSKWKSVALRTDTCYPIEGGGAYTNDTTLMSDLFTIPPDVDPTTVTYSDPVQIWEKKYVSLTKTVTSGEDSCIVATVKDWNPDWTSEKDGCLSSSRGKLKDKGSFFISSDFDPNGVSDSNHIFSSIPYSCQGTATNYYGTFWWHGGDSVTSNLYLNITNWDVNLFYPNGGKNWDLFIDSASAGANPPMTLIANYGYGKGVQDHFRPFHFMKPEIVPRNYLEIKGHSEGKYYRMYEFDGKRMKEITKNLMDSVDSSSIKPLAYWNVTDVCGKRRVIMELYNSGAPGELPVELKYKDFYIGSPYRPGSGDIAHSPFYRAKLFFDVYADGNSFSEETLTSVSPVAITDMIDELSFDAPFIGDYKGPIVLLQPKGAKFTQEGRPKFEYYYTKTESNEYGLTPQNVSLFAISNNGFLQDITSHAFENPSNKVLTLVASPNLFPGDGDSPFFVTLKDSQTVTYKPELTAVSSTNIDSALLRIKAPAEETLLIIRCDLIEEEFSLHLNRTLSALGDTFQGKYLIIDTMSVDINRAGIWEGYIHLESGDNYIFAGDRDPMLYAVTRDSTIKVRNCPVGFTKIELDITGPEIVFTRDPDPVISYPGEMESIAFYPTENAHMHYIKFKPSGEIADVQTFYSLANDITEIYWDGRDEYGRFYEEGTYPYILFGIDDFGNKSNEEKHRWEIRWGVPVEIVSPPEGVWLKGTQTLISRIEGEYNYPVDWYKKWNETWGYVGREDPSGEGLEWNTTFLPDEKNVWLKASVEDVFGHSGADSVRVRGIDNHPPEIYTWVGNPSYLDEFISGMTPIFASVEDTISGIRFFRYRIDGGSFRNLRDTFNLNGYQDGRHRIDFWTRDYADNDTTYSLSFYIDNTPPLSHLEFGEPKKMHNDTLYISPSTPIWVEARDTCGVARSFYAVSTVSGDVLQQWTEVIESFNIPYIPPNYKYIIHYYSEDHLGNTESPRDTVVAVDCDPPVTTLHIGTPRFPLTADSLPQYITSSTPLSFTATDDISGVDTTYYRIDSGTWDVYRETFNVSPEGAHTVEYYSVDKAGNREDVNSKELRVDETHPISELTTGDPNYELPGDSLGQILITSHTPLILTAEDPLSNGVASGVKELEYEIRALSADRDPLSATVEGDSTEFTITGEDGSYKVDYRARDNVLNEEPFNSKYYELDNTPPVAMILSPLDSTMVSHTITIIGTVSDKHFKEYVLEYGEGIDPGDWNTITVSDKEVEDSVLGKLNVSCIPGDIITVRLRATDLVENEGIDEVILWKGDLICEFDIPLHKPEGVDFDNEGNIYATDRKGGKKLRCVDRDNVKKFDPFGNLIYEITDRRIPNDVAVTPWNNILISEQVRKEITEFNQSQEYLRSIKYLKGPDGVDVTRLPDSTEGKLRCKDKEKGELKDIVIGVADQTANKIILYDSLFRKIKEIDVTERKLRCYHHPEGISFDKKGNVYTCLINNSLVRKYDLDGNILMEIKGFNQPSDIEVDYRGYIWVTDRNNDRIRCFDAYGNHLFKYGKKGKGCGEFNKPEGIAVNHERMYVADRNNDRVQVLRFPFSVRFPTLSSMGKTRQEVLAIQECVPYPNPCDPAVEFSNIRVVVNKDCEIEVRIYSLTGTLLWETTLTGFEGINEVTWNGMNQDGEEVRNGVYNVLVRAKDGSQKDEERTKIIVYRR